jgi:CheY-like chemotaxis protein
MLHPTILIVDDNPENLELLLSILSGRGYTLQNAVDATEALQFLERADTASLLLDRYLGAVETVSP